MSERTYQAVCDEPRQAWAGFIDWGRWSTPLFNSAVPEYLRTGFGRFDRLLPSGVPRFIEHHAYVFWDQAQSNADHWPDDFIQNSTERLRADWAREVARSLNDKPTEAKEAWPILRRYWERRLRADPLRISSEEASGLFEWLFLPDIPFREAAALYVTGPCPISSWPLRNEMTDLPFDEFPSEVGQIVLHVLCGPIEETRWDFAEIITLAQRIAPSDVATARAILLRLGELGSSSALDARSALDEPSIPQFLPLPTDDAGRTMQASW